ncbi:hypothetical protein FE257_006629 [Aspergillus nanangensis]|uniref:Arrestin-like N-terminal domain-containing protein n=1 Tax=Aspergillus nanangensis TaxID=2582783 RepID=A0AAD4CXV8_ASPNN|nr:hypothetical protein FE257_006629 [Aspergillus nanangensis]
MARRRGSRDNPVAPALDIRIAEPAVFIPTYTNNPAVLRGTCTLEVKDALVVKRLTVNFRGVSTVLWPHGFHDRRTITDSTFVVFDPDTTKWESGVDSSGAGNHPAHSRCRLWNTVKNGVRSLRRPSAGSECRLLSPGTHTYNFEMILPSHLPESINVRRSRVEYNVRACMESASRWKRKITHNLPITAVHCPAEDFVDDAEPVYITRTWRKLLRCEIIVSRRGAALGRHLPVTIAFTELNIAKVRGLQVFLLENVQYLQRNGLVSCLGPYKRMLLYEAMDDFVPLISPRGSVDDGRPSVIEREDVDVKDPLPPDRMPKPTGLDGTVVEVELPLPVCQMHSTEEDGLQKTMHFDTRYKNVRVHHWLEFGFFVSKNGLSATNEVRPAQKTLKAPFLLRSCYAHQANASLPAYTQRPDEKQFCSDNVVECIDTKSLHE